MSAMPARPFLSGAIILLLVSLFAGRAAADTVIVGGTGGDLATMRMLGEAFSGSHSSQHSHETAVTVLPSLSSSGGIRAVLAGSIDLAISSRPPKKSETEAGATFFAYAKTPLVFVTTATSAPDNLDTNDLIDIYGGTSASDQKFRIVLRPLSDGDTKILLKGLPELTPALEKANKRKGIPLKYTDQEAMATAENIKNSLIYSSLSVISGEGRNMNVLALNGVHPTISALADGTYPLVKTYYFIHGPKLPPLAKSFIDFVLSGDGKAILEATGHVPLTGDSTDG